MFYSQTFLARKGPLGTVWCAAHLQHRLKKSHYTSTDISSTVDRIMFPEVPIALRMSGHLLLGVVRIYSKKVEYLYHDCNVAFTALKKAFASTEVNLPENATTAKFDAVTLPLTFDLDEFDMDVDMGPNRLLDDHTRSQEEITLQDQIRTDSDPYVVVTFEDTMMGILQPELDGSGVRQSTSEDINISPPSFIPSNQIEVPVRNVLEDPTFINQTAEDNGAAHLEESNHTEPINGFQESGLSKERDDFNAVPDYDNSPPEVEVMREQPNILENISLIDDLQIDISEKNRSSDRGPDEDEICAPVEDAIPFQEHSSPFQRHTESPNSTHSHEASMINDTLDLSGHMSARFNMRSTPPVPPPNRKRKRKNFFDESTVLTNRYMKNQLENTGNILRKRKEIPCTALGIWKMSNAIRKEQVFSEPSLTGLCSDLCNILKKDFISTKPRLTVEMEVTPEPMDIPSPLENEPPHEFNGETSTLDGDVVREVRDTTSAPHAQLSLEHPNTSFPEIDPEIEHLRHADGCDGSSMSRRVAQSPSLTTFRIDELIPPTSPKSLGSEPVHLSDTVTGIPELHTQDYTAEMESPMTDLERQFDTGNYRLLDDPEFGNTAETEDLSFLEADNNASGSQGTEGVNSLSVRTRAVAQYLLRQSPVASISDDPAEDISLNKILKGRTRKLCARMFFETLVLKTYGLIDVRQEHPYGDISLKLTSTLAKSQI